MYKVLKLDNMLRLKHHVRFKVDQMILLPLKYEMDLDYLFLLYNCIIKELKLQDNITVLCFTSNTDELTHPK